MVGGPTLNAASVAGDEDAFDAVADRVGASPMVERAIAGTIATVTFESGAADKRLGEALEEGLKTFSVTPARIAAVVRRCEQKLYWPRIQRLHELRFGFPRSSD